jgi:hypothetical protein
MKIRPARLVTSHPPVLPWLGTPTTSHLSSEVRPTRPGLQAALQEASNQDHLRAPLAASSRSTFARPQVQRQDQRTSFVALQVHSAPTAWAAVHPSLALSTIQHPSAIAAELTVEDTLRQLLGYAMATMALTLSTLAKGRPSESVLFLPQVTSHPSKKSCPPHAVIHFVADIPELVRVQRQFIHSSTEDCDDPDCWTLAYVVRECIHLVNKEKILTLRYETREEEVYAGAMHRL